jgi:hypothetical protein
MDYINITANFILAKTFSAYEKQLKKCNYAVEPINNWTP